MHSILTPSQRQCAYVPCGTTFESTTPDKKYCSIRCRNAASRARERERQPATLSTNGSADSRYFMQPITNPTEDLVLHIAQVMDAAKPSKPTFFKTTPAFVMPRLQLPAHISLLETSVKGEWLMFWNATEQDSMFNPTASEQQHVQMLPPVEQLAVAPVVRRSPLDILNSILGEEKTK
jgi:predicted nucleic acid-binding Zn ribbon protein